jgi:hypothetical protein
MTHDYTWSIYRSKTIESTPPETRSIRPVWSFRRETKYVS